MHTIGVFSGNKMIAEPFVLLQTYLTGLFNASFLSKR